MRAEALPRAEGPPPAQSGLRVRPLPLDTVRENVVVLARGCTAVRPERLTGVRKVEIALEGRRLLATCMICDDGSLVGRDEVGLPQPLLRRLGAAPGAMVQVTPAPPSRTLGAVAAKVAGDVLTDAQYRAIARDLADHRWSDIEVAAFLISCASFMTADEVLSLTEAMVVAGRRLAWSRPVIVDKHCIGGIPGNRTSLIVAPIVAAHGLWMPKTSSRAITSPAGTADTMEVLARVDLDEGEMRDVVERCGACIVWGGRVNLSPADDVLIAVERPLSIDTPEQMVASILSKKLAAGATHLVLDVPVGPTAKIRDRRAALRLKKLFEHVAGRLGLGIEVLLTDTAQPIGFGVGPALEARDVRAVLEGRAEAPSDLAEKAVMLAGRVLEADPALQGGQGERRARELLASGAAARKMDEIMAAQGPSPKAPGIGAMTQVVCAGQAGRIHEIDCLRIASIARLAGAPTDTGAGVDLLRKAGASVSRGEPLFRIHGSERSDFSFACEAACEDDGYRITP
ncbi:MAG: thymidine phosphorylase family protein [Phenylobacterium sp.]|uniref:thymidine phosphorylase family protein n=1 Tax=Phenylobacterium sp. TaxID=1871053 RepID=UPI00273243FB|nr:thymidine phosphorylase family protein [Phenylobacterium sp.]MDP3749013.1 thymidine phosphorylase family protein [Phenylobacterium sp.]